MNKINNSTICPNIIYNKTAILRCTPNGYMPCCLEKLSFQETEKQVAESSSTKPPKSRKMKRQEISYLPNTISKEQLIF